MYTAFFYSINNADLESKVAFYCKKYCIELFVVKDFREMMLKGSLLSNYALFVDTTTASISSDLINYMLKQNGNPKLIGVILLSNEGYENQAVDNERVYNVCLDENFAKYFVSKADYLRDIAAKPIELKSDVANFVYDYLIELKLNSKYAGFGFIKDALIYCIAQGKGVDNLSLSVYPYIAAIHKTTINNVERNIRVAIESLWKNNHGVLYFDKKPSNKEFLSYILNVVTRKLDNLA